MTPATSFFFLTLAGDPNKVLLEAYDLSPGDLRRSMDEAVAQSGQYQGMTHLLGEIGSIFKPGLAVILHPNDYPEAEGDPKHDQTPVPLFAVLGKVRDMEAYNRVFDFLKQNWREFTGRSQDQTIQTVRFAGGATATSFVSRVVPGTGELVLLYIPTLETLVFTNSARFGSDIISTAFLDRKDSAAKRRQLLLQDSFKKALDGSKNGAHLFFWLDPGQAKDWLEADAQATAEEQYRLEKEAAWRTLRPQEEARLRQEMFGGRQNLSGAEASQLAEAVHQALLQADADAATRVPALLEANRRQWLPLQVLDWVSLGWRVSRRHAELLLQAELGG